MLVIKIKTKGDICNKILICFSIKEAVKLTLNQDIIYSSIGSFLKYI